MDQLTMYFGFSFRTTIHNDYEQNKFTRRHSELHTGVCLKAFRELSGIKRAAVFMKDSIIKLCLAKSWLVQYAWKQHYYFQSHNKILSQKTFLNPF